MLDPSSLETIEFTETATSSNSETQPGGAGTVTMPAGSGYEKGCAARMADFRERTQPT
jgi:hypothetical protein